MKATPTVGLSLILALVFVLSSLPCTPCAYAVVAPQIDETRLPAAALPSPQAPTVQRRECVVATATSTTTPTQLAGLDLPHVRQLTRGAGQRVAIIDTGVRRHPRLKSLVAGGDYVSTGDGTQDCDAHGTLVAGIIAATANPGTDAFEGVAPEVTLISIRQASTRFGPADPGAQEGVGDVGTMAKAVRTAADLGASVINISSVACVAVGEELDDRALGAALAYAVDVKNAVVVAAAGNTGGGARCPSQPPGVTPETVAAVVSPAWYDDYVLTVGSVDARGEPSSFTMPGPWVDVAAPGENVTSLSPVNDGIVNSADGSAAPLSGTSYAAPIASGLAALIRTRFPALTPRQVMDRITATAHPPPGGWDPFVGHGTVDVLAAVSTDGAPAAAGPRHAATPTRAPDPQPQPQPQPQVQPPEHTPASAANRARATAFVGTAICLLALLGAAGSPALKRAATPRSGRVRPDGVADD
ncbi:type VII secretion-associated serine protease mycosin [Mycobacterium sp.]|uniref:type VII secretion-associated serine protease mycosin n=1 Tax=Mycobacterium sp. TaxID=1785 RepID=UPI003A8BEF15